MSSAPRRDGVAARSGTAAALLVLVLAGCSQPASEPAPGPTADGSATLFGSNVWQAPGETRAEALARVDAAYGPIAIARLFSSWLPPLWTPLNRDLGDRPLVVSFRLQPAVVLSGRADERLITWFRNAPRDRDTYWVYFHEPEDEAERGDFAPEDFAAAWRHVADLAAAAGNPRLHATMILMCWTANEQSGRDWRRFVPDDGSVEVLAWDCYAKGTGTTPYADVDGLLDPAREASAAVGADWAIGELGAQLAPGADGTERAAWLAEVGSYAVHHDARFVAYFDAPVGGHFRLDDPPSIAAWDRLVGSPAGLVAAPAGERGRPGGELVQG